MGRKCCVESCLSDSNKQEHTGVTFHKVPFHSEIRSNWISLCRIPEDKKDAKLLFVCSRHFLRADFCSFKGKKYMLRQGVLPSVFPWDKSRLEAIKAETHIKKEATPRKSRQAKKKEIQTSETPSNNDVNEGTEDKYSEVSMETEIKQEPDLTKLDYDPVLAEDKGHTSGLCDDVKTEIKEESKEVVGATMNFNINSQIEVQDNNNVWHTAKIHEVDYDENEVLIHFDKVSGKCDEWISMTSARLRPVQPKSSEQFEINDRCMAVWTDNRKFPATVTKKVDNDSYEVLFDDGYVKVVKSHKMSKMNVAKPAQQSPLFDPVKGTKQDRRDKKRKLNVAALFSKRSRTSTAEERKNKSSPIPNNPSTEEASLSPVPQEDQTNLVTKWHPSWEDGKPVGIESTIEGMDGLRKSTIVPDPRLPPGWTKHLTQRIYGSSIGKWDTIILAPDGKKFRSKQEVKNYLELHPGVEASVEMFDFSLYGGRDKKKQSRARQKPQQIETPAAPIQLPTESVPLEEIPIKEEVVAAEESTTSLKIIFENNSYKCPIDGCDKNFRRENLALMHVKHYHSEYTKYLDSTPNVADLAYARTVGENLDKSPGPSKPGFSKALDKLSGTPKAQKMGQSLESSEVSAQDNKLKDAEIIKLLNQKPPDVSNDLQPLPSGLPSNMYPDIKLKDLLGKSDDIAMRDDIHIKNLCSSRPSQGIKTLLPVRHNAQSAVDSSDEKGGKRKKVPLDNSADAQKGPQRDTFYHHQQQQQQSSLSPLSTQPLPPCQSAIATSINHQYYQPQSSFSVTDMHESKDTMPSIPSAFDLAPPPAELEHIQAPTVTQFDGVIIEGGKIIKLERMKQEEIINCTCGFIEEDGLMIQCELCLCWQHAYCNNIQKESEVPEKYVCYICQHPLRERHSMKYLHDQDWLKQGILPVGSYHTKDKRQLEMRFEILKKSHDYSGGLLELREYLHTLAVKLKIAEAKNHPKLYLWSKLWEKRRLPDKADTQGDSVDNKLNNSNVKSEMDETKDAEQDDKNMLMMILKSNKEEDIPMLNANSHNMAPIIPRPEAPIDLNDCRLNLLDHIGHAQTLVEERLDQFEKQLEALEDGMNLEQDEDYPKTRQTLQLLLRDLGVLKQFSELPMG